MSISLSENQLNRVMDNTHPHSNSHLKNVKLTIGNETVEYHSEKNIVIFKTYYKVEVHCLLPPNEKWGYTRLLQFMGSLINSNLT